MARFKDSLCGVNMLVIRPVQLKDLDRLVQLAYQASFGLTSLPRGKKLLRKRILESIESFAKRATIHGENSSSSFWKTSSKD